uniref:DUF3778 domain-containing protein n=1 Tax=Oryza glumipatula TaxID=40148 RepID=A0A0D9ZJX9_9ORYZ
MPRHLPLPLLSLSLSLPRRAVPALCCVRFLFRHCHEIRGDRLHRYASAPTTPEPRSGDTAASAQLWLDGTFFLHLPSGSVSLLRLIIYEEKRACGQFVRINCRRPRPRRSPGPLPRRAPVRACREEVIGECVDAVLAVVALGCGKRGAVAGGGMTGEPPDAALDAARTAASPSCAGVEGPRGGVAFGFRF